MAWTTPATVTVGQFMTAAFWNAQVRDNELFLAFPVRVSAYRTADKSINDNTETLYDLDAEEYDSDGAHSTVTNNSRLIVPSGALGLYTVTAQARFASNATGVRTLQVRKNAAGSSAGGTRQAIRVQNASGGSEVTILGLTKDVELTTTGDYIEMFHRQTSGGSLNVIAGAPETFMQMRLSALA